MTSRFDDGPPFILDGARVLEYARFDGEVNSRTGSAVAGGVALDLGNVSGVVVVEDLAGSGIFLLHANADWETLAASAFADAASAKARAEMQFPGVERLWREFRALTPDERAELESTRNFLRNLASGEPEG